MCNDILLPTPPKKNQPQTTFPQRKTTTKRQLPMLSSGDEEVGTYIQC